jgi:hypothetical protein
MPEVLIVHSQPEGFHSGLCPFHPMQGMGGNMKIVARLQDYRGIRIFETYGRTSLHHKDKFVSFLIIPETFRGGMGAGNNPFNANPLFLNKGFKDFLFRPNRNVLEKRSFHGISSLGWGYPVVFSGVGLLAFRVAEEGVKKQFFF